MDTTQKVLIAFIVILGAVLLVSNIGRLTGNFYQESSGAGTTSYVSDKQDIPTTTKITVNPSLVKLGDIITIEVKVGDQGSDGKVDIYSPDARVAEIRLSACGDTCTPSEGRTLSEDYKSGMDWKAGEYYASVTDKGSGEQVKAYFTVG